jgi:hypothetical protein
VIDIMGSVLCCNWRDKKELYTVLYYGNLLDKVHVRWENNIQMDHSRISCADERLVELVGKMPIGIW